MPGYSRRTYGKGGSSKKKMKKTKKKYGMGGSYAKPMQAGHGMEMGASGMVMPNDVMAMNRAKQGKQMKGAMKLFNALAKKLGKKVR